MSNLSECPYLATGDYFRSVVRDGGPLASTVRTYMEAGRLIPDDIVIGEVRKKFDDGSFDQGFIFDGFPRTQGQANALDQLLEGRSLGRLQLVVFIDVPDEVVISRLSARRICDDCGAIYNLTNMPPKVDGMCDRCAGPLIQRADDVEETIAERLSTYREQTMAIAAYYEQEGLLHRLDGRRGSEEVSQKVLGLIQAAV
jgi:adenylate kinase